MTGKRPKKAAPAAPGAAKADSAAKAPATAQQKAPAAPADAGRAMEALRRRMKRAVEKLAAANRLVLGSGPVPARVMIIGEAPGRTETEVGEPFVGKAGSFFVGLMEEVFKLPRSAFYITNVVKVWPTVPTKRLRTRPPTTEEFNAFTPLLIEEIGLVSPRVIIAVGKTAFKALLPDEDFSPGEWRATPDGVPVMAVYHPAYIQRKQKTLEENTRAMKAALGKVRKKAARG